MTTQQVLDKQGLQHYATKMCNAENRKVGSKSLPTALNDIDIAIDGFKTLFDNEYGAPITTTIENNSNIFTIGKGNGIDKSNEVENSFTDIELSGNSMVNIIQQKSYLDWYIYYCGRKTTEGVFIGRGAKYASSTHPDVRYSTDVRCNIISKSNSTYTLIFNAAVLEGSSPEFMITYNGICNVGTARIKNGKNVIRIQSDDTQNGTFQIYAVSGVNNEEDINIKLTDIIMLEGDHTNNPTSYFQGLKSVGENEENKISILSFEKASLIPKEYFLNNKTTNFRGWSSFPETLDLKDVVVKFKVNRFLGNDTHIKIWIGNNELNGVLGKEVTMNCTTLTSIGFYNWNDIANGGGKEKIIEYLTTGALELIILPNINHGYPFYPYFNSNKKDKKEISLNEPLRSLGDVKDTIEKINGEWKIVRRCKEVVYNGNENLWLLSGDNRKYLERNVDDLKGNGKALSDTLPKVDFSAADMEHPIGFMVCGHPAFRFNVMSKNNMTLQEGLNWLSQNPTRVIYELKTPIIEDIDPVVLQCWKGGNIFIDEVLPVESTHTVALNKPAQIQSNIEELTSLRDRVQKLEEQYNSTVLTQAYETILLNFDMNL